MAKNKKWLGDVEPGHSISDVAKEAIATRSSRMLEYLPLAAKQWKEDTEYVHQLRTWSRRTQAALQLFATLLPLKRSTAVRKATQKLRKAGGSARDLDVFMKRIRKAKFTIGDDDKAEVLTFLKSLRKKAQPQLVKAWQWAKSEDLQSRFQGIIKRTRWREVSEEESLEQMAPTLLEPLVVRFFHFSQQLSQSPEALHQMRIEAKKTRYAMELVESGFPDSFRDELYPAFEEVQSKLGVINDHHTVVEKIRGWEAESTAKKFPGFLKQLSGHEQVQFDEKAEAFRIWWTDQRSQELKEHFDHYLGGLGLSPSV
ncbi:CHAD domain-containing protein [Bremerella sp. T1]|uniref:CHAD domain-containing protein n=1 Tax=Bremerella sp. TYQ1 TaxID=3119568 RepID=UPI001CCD065E|nr:CHAD domain-containing protein [Bremerella volcania]UBM37438.1 CHAD domain-containing protein [Bremerella volcania]